jgi:hypothetical protein
MAALVLSSNVVAAWRDGVNAAKAAHDNRVVVNFFFIVFSLYVVGGRLPPRWSWQGARFLI